MKWVKEWRRVVFVVCCCLCIAYVSDANGSESKGTAAPAVSPAPAAPVTPWPVIKNVPLCTPFGEVKISFGGDARLRYEDRHNFYDDTEGGVQYDDGLWYLRTRVNMGAVFNEHLSGFVEGLDAREWDSKASPNTQEDNFDLHQAYITLTKPADLPLSLRAGRQELEYGAKRLISAPRWGNKIRAFDAGRLSFNPSCFGAIDLIYGKLVLYQDDKFNPDRWSESFFGVYSTYKNIPGQIFDLYWLAVVDKDTGNPGDLERYTVGTRGEGKVPGITNLGYGYEVAYQYGDNGVKDIEDAYAYHVDINYAIPTVVWQPKFTLEYNVASGDEDPNDGEDNGFNPLYQTVHDPYGLIDFFRWQNVNHYGAVCDLVLHPKVKSSLQYHRFYLNEDRDAWYDAGGKKLRQDKTGSAGSHVGDEIDVCVKYQVLSYLGLEGGYAHFFAGEYVDDTSKGNNKGDEDSDWFYAQAVFSF